MTCARNLRFSTHVWWTQSDKIQNRTWRILLRMHRSNRKIQILVVHAHSSESSAVWACLASQITDYRLQTSSVVIRRATSPPSNFRCIILLYYVLSIMPREFTLLNKKTLATINHQPGQCFFTFGPIYKLRA